MHLVNFIPCIKLCTKIEIKENPSKIFLPGNVRCAIKRKNKLIVSRTTAKYAGPKDFSINRIYLYINILWTELNVFNRKWINYDNDVEWMNWNAMKPFFLKKLKRFLPFSNLNWNFESIENHWSRSYRGFCLIVNIFGFQVEEKKNKHTHKMQVHFTCNTVNYLNWTTWETTIEILLPKTSTQINWNWLNWYWTNCTLYSAVVVQYRSINRLTTRIRTRLYLKVAWK